MEKYEGDGKIVTETELFQTPQGSLGSLSLKVCFRAWGKFQSFEQTHDLRGI